MQSLDLRRGAGAVGLTAPLRELSELDILLRRKWPQLRAPIVLPWTEMSALAMDEGRAWQFGPAERDPAARNGRTVVPRAQRRQLARLAEIGVPVQRVAVAHELDPHGLVRQVAPLLRSGPQVCTDEVARVLVGSAPTHPGLTRAARLLDAVVGGVGRGAVAGYDLLLDPVIFGVVAQKSPVHGEPALWYELCSWVW